MTQEHAREVRAIWKVAAFAGLALVGLLPATVVALVLSQLVPEIDGQAVFYVLGTAATVAASWLCVRLFDRQPFSAIGLGLDRPWGRHLLLGMLAGAGLCVAYWGVYVVAGWAQTTVNPDLARQRSGILWGALLCVGLAAQEETLVRGYGFQIVARWNLPVALLLAGAAFVSLHLPHEGGKHPVTILNMFLGHLLFAACYLRTRSLWLPIGLHTAWNFTQVFVLGIGSLADGEDASVLTTECQQNLWTGSAYGPEGGLVVTLLLLLAIVVIWRCVRQRHPAADLMVDRPGMHASEQAVDAAVS